MELTIQRDGLKLYGLLEGTTTIKNDTVAILMHGFKGNLGYDDSAILYALSHYLNQQGIPTLRFDFDGAGNSDGDFADMTVFSEILDGMKIIDYAHTTMQAKKIYLIGHSQGGVVASMLAGYYRDIITKLVLLAPAATLKDDALKGVCQGSHYDPNHIPNTVNVSGYSVGGGYFRTAQLMPIYETAQHYGGPTLLIHGEADNVVSPEASQKYNVIMPNSELHLIPDEGHMFNGAKRQEIIELVASFLKQ
ncbi:alpha/beta hydrolase [Limosilactobacillus sp. RRLNB_1_1]|uniref:Alpha/beta hydrolase n=1 Tax=Limosilactobacillus albertensis TaxID=2759752 RepID=A0A7W3Y8B1_9LACO|nr:alpha/beta fold hydrolase [Limosilactobacillus albertensis]MBB1069476.1 alpha/beta hydrolase [Limosilactobacillus albertensis]MCD7118002.1 alpha/beta hydrolase [Limosilactobacillus albertensis]MCD7127744.1 alpha/beta hydrolase [Limosilactobacillus albertensis]